MKTPYVRRTREIRHPRFRTDCGFRLIRCFSPDHNAQRFLRHVAQQVAQDRRTASGRRFAMKMRRRNSAGRSLT